MDQALPNQSIAVANPLRHRTVTVPDAELHLLDAGHFALDDHLEEIAGLVADFIARHAQ